MAKKIVELVEGKMKSIGTKTNYLSKAVIIGIICSCLGKYLPSKYLLILIIFLALTIVASFINALAQKKEAIKNKYFYHFYISLFIGMLMFIFYLLGKTKFNWIPITQEIILFSMALSFIYFLLIGLIMLLNSSNKEMIKVAKISLGLFIFSIVIIVSIIIFSVHNKSKL